MNEVMIKVLTWLLNPLTTFMTEAYLQLNRHPSFFFSKTMFASKKSDSCIKVQKNFNPDVQHFLKPSSFFQQSKKNYGFMSDTFFLFRTRPELKIWETTETENLVLR